MVKKFKTFGPQLVFAEQAAGSVVVTNEQKLSLYKKSQKSGISTDILEEVYRRGYSIWNESFGQTAEQFAFDRVNSFIAGGFAADLDEDLMIKEGKRGLWDNIHAKQERIKHGSGEHMRKPGSKGAPTDAAFKASQNEEADPCWDGYHQIGMKMKKGKKVPNCVPVKEAANAAQQAAIAIAMKKAGKKPKNQIKEADEKFTNRVQPENDTPDTDASDRQSAVGKVGLKLRGGRDINPSGEVSDAQKQKALEAGENALDAAQLVPGPVGFVAGLGSAAKNAYQGNYGKAAIDVGGALLSGTGAKPAYAGAKKIISLVKEGHVRAGVTNHNKGHFTNNETVEKQSHNPNDSDSRFDGTKSAKNVYQKATPGQPVTEDATTDTQQVVADRSKILDQLIQANKDAQNPPPKTSVSQAADRRQFNQQGEVKTMIGAGGEKYTTTVPNQAVVRKQPTMTNALTTIKRVVKESYVCDNCDCGLHEEILNERGADSKGYFRSTESGAGLTAKGAAHFRREHPGSKLSTAVTEKNPTGRRAARRRSFCARMSGMKGPMKDEKGRPTRKAMSLRRWHC